MVKLWGTCRYCGTLFAGSFCFVAALFGTAAYFDEPPKPRPLPDVSTARQQLDEAYRRFRENRDSKAAMRHLIRAEYILQDAINAERDNEARNHAT